MPAQLSTILYVLTYKESSFSMYLIGTATGVTRLNENDSVQLFNMTIFYPINPEVPSYVPKIAEGQVLSINNCKFSLGKDNEIEVN